ncbi:hypothetical protein KGQ27_02790 [Patescibacteria group bacterium]|nr:hypothetical protein [Patescibacteria group bacterium]MDE1946795.1 hypothetical protein [Patescibacteria group bacterium]MDE2011073.1 hypothetical protein [Patescibacteria group bacterium]MDE2233130.1 hypothetical protein [Patescibacteria group bacterium]
MAKSGSGKTVGRASSVEILGMCETRKPSDEELKEQRQHFREAMKSCARAFGNDVSAGVARVMASEYRPFIY